MPETKSGTEALAAAQAEAKRLREALETLAEHFEYYMGDNECRPLENARTALSTPADTSEIDRLVTDAGRFIECRSSLVLDMNNYARVLAEMERSGQQDSAAYRAVEQDRARLHSLIEAIDARAEAEPERSG